MKCVVLLFYLILFFYKLEALCLTANNADDECELLSADYTQRPTLVYVCGSTDYPELSNNYCLRDDIEVKREGVYIHIMSNGCPGKVIRLSLSL